MNELRIKNCELRMETTKDASPSFLILNSQFLIRVRTRATERYA